jgi:capsular polysaccharide biosynthesis protein
MDKSFLIQKLKNVFVTNNCVIIKDNNILRDSCVGEEYYKKYLKPKFRLKYFFPIFSFSKKQHILITDEWSKNYCHWIWEALSKLVEMKKNFSDTILLLPKSYLKIDFMMKSLEAFGFNDKNIKIIPKKSRIKIRNLAFISCINISTPNYYDFLKFREISQKLISYYKEKLKTNFGTRIYISRSNPKKDTIRRIKNEKELREMLAKYGFKTVYMENFSFIEQISISYFAEFIISPHGAGITNIIFSEKCHLIELVNEKWQKTCFAEMCERSKIKYDRINCKQDDERQLELANINIDIEELEKKLIKTLK